MVNKSEILLAIYDNSEKGGTFHTVNLAIKQHLKVIQFHPHKAMDFIYVNPQPNLQGYRRSLVVKLRRI